MKTLQDRVEERREDLISEVIARLLEDMDMKILLQIVEDTLTSEYMSLDISELTDMLEEDFEDILEDVIFEKL